MKESEFLGYALAFAAYALIVFGVARCAYAAYRSRKRIYMATAVFLAALFASSLAIAKIFDSKEMPPIVGKALVAAFLSLVLIFVFGHFVEKKNKRKEKESDLQSTPPPEI